MAEIVEKRWFYRLAARFGLEDFGLPQEVKFNNSVQPVTQVDDLVKKADVVTATKDLTVLAGTFVPYFIIPDDERWEVLMVQKGTTTGTSRPYIIDSEGDIMDIGVAFAALTMYYWGQGHVCEAGWVLGLFSSGNVADGAVIMRLWVKKEKSLRF